MNLVSSLCRHVPSLVRSRGETIFRYRGVRITGGDSSTITALVAGSEIYEVRLECRQGGIGAACTCPYARTEVVCKHIWATVLAAERSPYLQAANGASYFAPAGPDEFELDSFQKPFTRFAPVPRPPQWKTLLAAAGVEGNGRDGQGWRPGREIHYAVNVPATIDAGKLYLDLAVRDRKQNGEWGKPKPAIFSRSEIGRFPPPPTARFWPYSEGVNLTINTPIRRSRPVRSAAHCCTS